MESKEHRLRNLYSILTMLVKTISDMVNFNENMY